MTPREKKLLALVGLIGLLWGVNLLFGKYADWKDRAVAARNQAIQTRDRAELDYHRATYARKMLRRWEQKSLPSDAKVAEAEYRNWLIDQLRAAKLSYESVKPTGGAQRGVRTKFDHIPLGFAIQAEGKMDAILSFLDGFYRSDQLHKITKLSLTPKKNSSDTITASIDIEALSIQGLDRPSGLATGESDRLALASSKDYVERIGERKVFAEYVPPKPPQPERTVQRSTPRPRSTPPKFDDSERAFFNAAVQGKEEGALQAWVNVRTTGESFQLGAGDKFEIGELKGEVASVSSRELVIDTDEGKLAIKIGESLRSGKKVSRLKTDAGG